MHEDQLSNCIFVRTGNHSNLHFIYIDDQNKYLYQGQAEYGAEPVSIDLYNILANNNSNILFLYHLPTFNLRNVSFANYSEW